MPRTVDDLSWLYDPWLRNTDWQGQEIKIHSSRNKERVLILGNK
jgi:hypothetical protein